MLRMVFNKFQTIKFPNFDCDLCNTKIPVLSWDFYDKKSVNFLNKEGLLGRVFLVAKQKL